MRVESGADVAEGVALLGQGDERLRGTCVRRIDAEAWEALLEVVGKV